MADSLEGARIEKPSRSEELESAEEQEKRAEAVRQNLEALLPKRPLKPSRSDVDELVAAKESEASFSSHSPEFLRFQELEDSSGKLSLDRPMIVVEEEYVETKYYNDFSSAEKLHHTTGTGFIELDPPEIPPFRLSADQRESGEWIHQRGNPVTNEWEPNPRATFPVSSKPERSESV